MSFKTRLQVDSKMLRGSIERLHVSFGDTGGAYTPRDTIGELSEYATPGLMT